MPKVEIGATIGDRRNGARGSVRFGSNADIARCQADVRFTPKSGHWNPVAACPLYAKSGLMQCSANQRIIDNSFGWRVEEIARERQGLQIFPSPTNYKAQYGGTRL